LTTADLSAALKYEKIWLKKTNVILEMFKELNYLHALGMIPFDSSLSAPNIVYVFPDPVWPYVKIVELNPNSTSLKKK